MKIFFSKPNQKLGKLCRYNGNPFSILLFVMMKFVIIKYIYFIGLRNKINTQLFHHCARLPWKGWHGLIIFGNNVQYYLIFA